MQVAELTVLAVHIPLKRAIRHASHTRTSTDNIIVRCVLDDRTEGYGEGVPREYVTGESVDTALALLRKSEVSSQLRSCRSFSDAVEMVERITLAPVEGDERGCQGNAARCALELALLDAYGKHFQTPLSEVSRLLVPELFQPRVWVRYSGSVTSANGFAKIRLAAWRNIIFRFSQVKVKVGIEGHDDIRRLRLLRSRLGTRVDLRIDANEAWTADEAAERICELEPFGITSVEQPVPHAAVHRLAAVRKNVHVPLMLDESLCSPWDARKAVDEKLCDLFNLRLSKCGGYIPTLRLAQFARLNGLGYQLGCQVGETAILSAAGRHFASTVADIRYLEGSYDRFLVREALGTQDITFRWGGWAPALQGFGLGLTVNPASLERVTFRKTTLS